MKRSVIGLISLNFLAACGGSSGSGSDPVRYDPASGSIATDEAFIALNPAGTQIVLDTATGTRTVATGSAPSVGTYDVAGYIGGADRIHAYISETDDSRAALATFAEGGGAGYASNYERINTTTPPTSGTATAEGDYISLLVNKTTGLPIGNNGIVGDASLSANFSDGTIEGSVTDRRYVNMLTGTQIVGSSVEDLIYEETSISSTGRFSGTATDGELTAVGTAYVTSDGAYEGLVAGTDGSEIVGASILTQTAGMNERLEVGSFAAGH